MAKFPAMPLWTDAYLADCGHLDDAETGRYLMMLIHLWRAPNQRFPNDDTWLARKFRRSVDDVRAELRPLINEFCKSTGNWISQERLSREFAYVTAKSEKQRDRSNERWRKEKELSHGNAIVCNAPTPTPTPTPIKKESPPKPPKGGSDIEADEFEKWYGLYPRKIAKGAARRAFKKARKQAEQAELVTAVKTYAATVSGKDQEFIPHPATWLNAERWLDSEEAPNASSQVSIEKRVEVAKDWLSRNDNIPTWMDSRETAEALVKEGYDYDKLRLAGFSLPPRGNIVDIAEAGKAKVSVKKFGGDKIPRDTVPVEVGSERRD